MIAACNPHVTPNSPNCASGPKVTEDAKTALIIRGARHPSAGTQHLSPSSPRIPRPKITSHRGKHRNTWDSNQRHASRCMRYLSVLRINHSTVQLYISYVYMMDPLGGLCTS